MFRNNFEMGYKMGYHGSNMIGKILIVDDEPMVTKTLKTLLTLEGWGDVECFNNPLEAVEFLKIQEVALIISDFIMLRIAIPVFC